MSLHRLSSITIGVPEPEPVRAFYRDFGLAEAAPGRFETADGGEQLRIEAAPRRRLLALRVGVDDADDLARTAAALAKLGVAAERSARSLVALEPVTAVRVELALEPRLAQKPPPLLALNAPGRSPRLNARSPAVLPGASARPRKLSHAVIGSPDAAASRRGEAAASESTPGGRNLSAALGILSTLGFDATTILTLAVIPGKSFCSEFWT